MSHLFAIDDSQASLPDMASYRILCVDDEPHIVSALKRMFALEGFAVDTASGGAQALQMMQSQNYQLVLSDMHMPHMDGAAFLRQVRADHPKAMRLMLTAATDLKDAVAGINEGGIYRYLAKPWNDAEVVATVREALEKYALLQQRDQLLALTQQQNTQLAELVSSLEVRVQQRTQALNQSLTDLRSSYVASIKAYSKLLGLRSSGLLVHAKAVAELAVKIAKVAQCSPSDVQDIYIAGLLHDIGKIGLTDEMLLSLSAGEGSQGQKFYEAHVLAGQECLSGLYEMDRVASYIATHHEQFNGAGFPKGLSGAAIPLGGRILAVVEAFEEFQIGNQETGRVSPKEAALMIHRLAGRAFCPDVCRYFFQVLGMAEPLGLSAAKPNPGAGSVVPHPAPANNGCPTDPVSAQPPSAHKEDVLVRNVLKFSELLAFVALHPGAQVVDERGGASGYLWVRQAGGTGNASPKLVKWLTDRKFIEKPNKGWFLPLL